MYIILILVASTLELKKYGRKVNAVFKSVCVWLVCQLSTSGRVCNFLMYIILILVASVLELKKYGRKVNAVFKSVCVCVISVSVKYQWQSV